MPACFSLSAMKAAKNDSDWAIALLVGVFGEDAKLIRVYPRKQGLKKFPLGFLILAQSIYSIVMKYWSVLFLYKFIHLFCFLHFRFIQRAS